ncbi:MAG: hypothetical protein LAN83_17345 [Acidobacteriia bacterium]|nr:hypothetical protein [Terriglobia bacterium]
MKTTLIGMIILVLITVAGAQQPAASAPQAAPQKTISSYLGLHTFPAKNQAKEQQQQDEMACYDWAKQDSGFDPLAALTAQQQAASPAPAQANMPDTRGAGVKGAAGGAATGAVVGAIAGDAGKGAAAGAAAGAMTGRARARRAERQAQMQAQQQQQQQAQKQAQAKADTQQKLDGFKKGFGACMEAKGYVVK